MISYMCERLMVMHNAEPVEILTREQLRLGQIAEQHFTVLVGAA